MTIKGDEFRLQMRGYGRSTPEKTRDGKTRNYQKFESSKRTSRKKGRGKRR